MQIQKEKLALQVINAEKNKGVLDCAPHRMFHDLAVVYMQKETSSYKNDYTLITTAIAEQNNMSEEELFQVGLKNLVKNSKIVLKSPKGNLWTLSDANASDGLSTALVLLDAPLAALAKHLDTDLYLIPASIYEWMVAPADLICAKILQSFVREGNKELNKPCEILSEHIYKYDKKAHKVYLVE